MPNTFSKAKFYVSIPINNSKKKSEKREMLASHLYHHLYSVYLLLLFTILHSGKEHILQRANK
jgi:hypothetical protein